MNMYQNFYQGMVPPSYQQQKPVQQANNWLTPERKALLQKNVSQFKLSVTDEDMAVGQCNHYDNGAPCLIEDGDGSGGFTCKICGTHISANNFSVEDAEIVTGNFLSLLDNIKLMYTSLPQDSALEFFQIYPLCAKVPQLYKLAMEDYKKRDNQNDFVPANGVNPFNMYAAMTNPGFGYGMNMMQPQQPMYNGYQQPMQQGYAPQGNVAYAQQNPAYNPIYGQPQYAPQQPMQQGYAPQAPVAGYQPQGYQQPVQGYAPQQQYVNTNMPNAMNPTGAAQPVQQPAAPAPQAASAAPQPGVISPSAPVAEPAK